MSLVRPKMTERKSTPPLDISSHHWPKCRVGSSPGTFPVLPRTRVTPGPRDDWKRKKIYQIPVRHNRGRKPQVSGKVPGPVLYLMRTGGIRVTLRKKRSEEFWRDGLVPSLNVPPPKPSQILKKRRKDRGLSEDIPTGVQVHLSMEGVGDLSHKSKRFVESERYGIQSKYNSRT